MQLLANGSFEQGLAGWEVVGGGVRVVEVGPDAAHGGHCLELAPPASEAMATGYARFPLTLEPGRRYALHLRIQAGFDAPSARLALALDEPVLYQELAVLSTGQVGGSGRPARGSWTRHEIRFFARASGHALVLGPLTRFSPQVEWGPLWIDDLRLEALDQVLTRGTDHEHRLVLPSDAVVGEELTLAITDLTFLRAGKRVNVGVDVISARPLPLAGTATLTCSDPAAEFPSTLTFAGETRHVTRVRLATPGVQRFELQADGHVVRSNPVRVHASAPGRRALWGDIHIHTRYEHADWFGGEADQNYTFARDVAGLDFAALSEHYTNENRLDWYERLAPVTEAFNQTGRFVTLLGVERGSYYGHWNTYLRDGERERMFVPELREPLQARRSMRAQGTPFLVLPHHMMLLQPTDWSLADRRSFRLAELYSNHGSSEEVGAWWRHPHQAGLAYTQGSGARGHDFASALRRGLRIGAAASSDDHNGRPGLSGLTCALAERLERGAVFDALAARRTFATSGARLLLDLEVDGTPQGGEVHLARGTALAARLEVHGSAELTRLELLRGDEILLVREPGSLDFEETFALPPFDGTPTYFRARVFQADGHRAWSSPVWIDPLELPDLAVEESRVALEGDELVVEVENLGAAPGSAQLDVFSSKGDPRLALPAFLDLKTSAFLVSLEPRTTERFHLRMTLLTVDLMDGVHPFRARIEGENLRGSRVVEDPRGALRQEGGAWVLEEQLGGTPRAPSSGHLESSVLEFELAPGARLRVSVESERPGELFLGSRQLESRAIVIEGLHGLADRTRLARRALSLAPLASERLRFRHDAAHTYQLVLDADEALVESEERNNRAEFRPAPR